MNVVSWKITLQSHGILILTNQNIFQLSGSILEIVKTLLLSAKIVMNRVILNGGYGILKDGQGQMNTGSVLAWDENPIFLLRLFILR